MEAYGVDVVLQANGCVTLGEKKYRYMEGYEKHGGRIECTTERNQDPDPGKIQEHCDLSFVLIHIVRSLRLDKGAELSQQYHQSIDAK